MLTFVKTREWLRPDLDVAIEEGGELTALQPKFDKPYVSLKQAKQTVRGPCVVPAEFDCSVKFAFNFESDY